MKNIIKLWEVGGCVRDDILGVPTKDIDFAVEAPSFEAMEAHILAEGMRIFQTKREFLTIRAGVPKEHPLRARCKDADFVLCRRDGVSTDGRRPDSVSAGSILDDLARRDLTVNALARCPITGSVLDPHGGISDLESRIIRFVGDAMRRIDEDGLRVLRALRFSITKVMKFAPETAEALSSDLATERLAGCSTERIMGELNKMFACDTLATLALLESFPGIREACFSRPGLSIGATMKKRK